MISLFIKLIYKGSLQVISISINFFLVTYSLIPFFINENSLKFKMCERLARSYFGNLYAKFSFWIFNA